MGVALLFWTLTLTSCAVALLFGGSAGRWAGISVIVAVLLTLWVWILDPIWVNMRLSRLIIDAGLLMALAAAMFRSQRFWPIWMVGWQAVGVLTHVASYLAPEFAPDVYRALQGFWALPVLLSMTIGVSLDWRAGIRGIE